MQRNLQLYKKKVASCYDTTPVCNEIFRSTLDTLFVDLTVANCLIRLAAQLFEAELGLLFVIVESPLCIRVWMHVCVVVCVAFCQQIDT